MSTTAKIVVAAIIGLIIGYLIGAISTGGSDMMNDDEMMNEDNVAATGDALIGTGDSDDEMGSSEMMDGADSNIVGTTNESITVDPVMATGENILSVNDQASGEMVVVANASLAQDSWLAVAENREGYVWILGARFLPAGEHSNVVVDLLRPTTANTAYAVAIYADDGVEGFNFKSGDALLTNESGMPISETFATVE